MKISLIGMNGSGKSSLGKMLSSLYNIPILTVGDVLRNPDDNPWIKEIIGDYDVHSGDLLSDIKVIQIMERLVREKGQDGWVLDGMPRQMKQAREMLRSFPPNVFIYLDAPNMDVIEKRLSGRRHHLASGRMYNVYYSPPKVEGKDDVTGEPLTIRKDDTLEIIRKRIKIFQDLTMPVVDYLANEQKRTGIPFITIDASESLDTVLAKTTQGIINSLVDNKRT